MTTVVLRSVKGAALTFTDMDNNFQNLNTDKIESISADSSPSLGGNLDTANFSIVSTTNNDIAITPDGTGQVVLDGLRWPAADGTANYYLQTDGAGNLSWGSGGSGLSNVVDDTTPQLGGSLDVNGNSIVSVAAGNIAITPDTTGSIVLDGLNWPQADGTTGQVLYTDGANQLAFKTVLENVVEDLSPQLAGSLDVQTHSITTSATNGNIILAPNGAGVVYSTSAAVLADYGASGYGVVTGDTSKGFAAFTNNGAQGPGDPQFALNNGGGATLSSGAGALSFNGASATFNGINVNNLQLDDYKETIYTGGATTGTITPDVANGNVQAITLTGNITFNAFANAEAGQSMTLIITQSATGGETLTSTMKFAGGAKTLSTGANEVDILSVFYDGSTYYASLATNFS